jgi:hypothetical protein
MWPGVTHHIWRLKDTVIRADACPYTAQRRPTVIISQPHHHLTVLSNTDLMTQITWDTVIVIKATTNGATAMCC